MAKRPIPTRQVSASWSWQLKIELLDVNPVVWRRLVVPPTVKLPNLHQVFQAALGWTNSHLHEFVINGVRYSDPDPDFDDEIGHVDEQGVILDNALGMDTRCFDYVYDFGDDWHHAILVENQHLQSKASKSFQCLAGENAAPPEDIGGALRYAEFLAAIADPSHDEHASFRESSSAQQFDPRKFDLKACNRALAKIKA
jgi:Plasmid pRiA4b ORF-3-like protein